MKNISFRKAHANEGHLLTELALRSKSHWPYSPEYLAKCRTPLTVDENYIEKWPVHVLTVGNRVVGFHSFYEKNSRRWLDNLWLEPSCIGSGLGEALFKHATNTARTLNWLPFVIAGDPFALRFYMRMGCKLVGFDKSQVLEGLYLPLLEFSGDAQSSVDQSTFTEL